MKKTSFAFSLFAVALMAVATQAGSFSISGGGLLPAGVTSGTLSILYNPAPDNIAFNNGGVALSVLSSTPGVIKFTSATTLNPPGRWTAVVTAPVTNDSAPALDGFSVGSPGMPTNGSSVYGEINFEVVGQGTTTLSLVTHGEDALYDGVQGDVTSRIELLGTTVSTIPEPASLAMAGMSLIGLALRRRNG